MVPKKATDLIAEFAQQKGIPEEDAKAMIVGFWRELREQQSNLVHWGFVIRGLGRTKASFKKLKKRQYMALRQKELYRKDKKNPLYQKAIEELKEVTPILHTFYAEWKREKDHRIKYFQLLKQQRENGMETKAARSLGKPGKDS